jgi:hypothetical protein
MTTSTSATTQGNGCPLGCMDPSGEDCKASLIQPCPWGRYAVDESGRFQPCGCLERERCQDCRVCTNCEGCVCEEDSDG